MRVFFHTLLKSYSRRSSLLPQLQPYNASLCAEKGSKAMQSLHCARVGGLSLAAWPLLCVATGEYNEKGWFT